MTKSLWRVVAGLAVVAVLGEAAAQPNDWRLDRMALHESLRFLPPNMRFREMRRLGLCDRTPAAPAPESTGLRLVGKWGGGPSVKVTGRDSLVFLSRGSEVVAINFADTANPEVLSYMQVNGLVSRSVLVGDRLYVGSTGSDPKYIDVFDVANPAAPTRLGSLRTFLNDVAVQDTLVYAIADDSFKVYNFADPANPRLLGACRDSGYHISVCNGYAYLGDRWGLYVIDARNPASPRRAASWGTDIISVTSRNTICCVTTGNPNQPTELNFSVLDVANPAAPFRTGYLADAGGYDMLLVDSLAFLSGYYTGSHEFRILSIADSTAPVHLGQLETPGEGNAGVWADLHASRAYVADRYSGMLVSSIADLRSPVAATTLLAAGEALDVSVDGHLVYVAGQMYGMTILDATSAADPREIGSIDSAPSMVTKTVAARDSFAYMGWAPTRPWLRAVSVADPTNPVMAGGADVFRFPEDMVLRDSWLYVAQAYRFQVVNVARPREPRLVGSCVAGDLTRAGLVVMDSWTYFVGPYVGLQLFNIADPTSPLLVATVADIRAAGCDVVDTLLYVGDYDDSLHIWSFANPLAPYQISATAATRCGYGVAVLGRYAYVGCDARIRAFDVRDARHPVEVAFCDLPYEISRVVGAPDAIYVCCWDAGVSIIDTATTGLAELGERATPPRSLLVLPNPTGSRATITGAQAQMVGVNVTVRDVTGRRVQVSTRADGAGRLELDLSDIPAGLYFVRLKVDGQSLTVKVGKH